ncbi:MAG: CdaR family protein [Sphingobacteriales bacterium JAD_PAG50586_3]|nr:MAG: CdaR family protein [Sphingobacteriales bacterium JAD_PAG50586_3]
MEIGEIFTTRTLNRLFRPGGRLLAFALCVVVAGFLWVLTALTRPYKVLVDFEVTYQNANSFGVKEANLPRQVSIELEDYGYNIVGYRFRNQAHTINVDFNNYRIFRNYRRNESYILLNYKPEVIARQLSNEATVLKVEPDTLFVSASERVGKKVPVVLKSDFIYKKQYMQAGDIIVTPDSITINGPKAQIERIDYVETEVLAKEEIESPFEDRAKIARNGFGSEVQMSPNTVGVKVDVQEFTEGTLEVPIQQVNVPVGIKVVLIPDKAIVKYRVPLSYYAAITAADFKVQADCRNVLTQTADHIKLTIAQRPKSASSANIIDDRVRYLIKR